MTIAQCLENKELKAKEKSSRLAEKLLEGQITVDEIVAYAREGKAAYQAICMECIEYATKERPSLITKEALKWVQASLLSGASKLKWEAAKVIGNTAHLFEAELDPAIDELIKHTKHEGTVVRWSVAYALTRICELPQYNNPMFKNKLQQVMEAEEKNSIKKMYAKVLK